MENSGFLETRMFRLFVLIFVQRRQENSHGPRENEWIKHVPYN